MKKCFKCKKKKSLSEFYKHSQMKDGHLNKCKACAKLDVKKNIDENCEYYKLYDSTRANLPHRVKARKEYAKTDEGRKARRRASASYKVNFPNKRKATSMVNNAIRDGRLFAEPCEICGDKENVQAHHDDYSKPLNVRWLCIYDHNLWHIENEPLNP